MAREIVLAEFEHGSDGVIRLMLQRYRDSYYVSLRRWQRSTGGELRATVRGANVNAEHLDELRAGLERAAQLLEAGEVPA